MKSSIIYFMLLYIYNRNLCFFKKKKRKKATSYSRMIMGIQCWVIKEYLLEVVNDFLVGYFVVMFISNMKHCNFFQLE